MKNRIFHLRRIPNKLIIAETEPFFDENEEIIMNFATENYYIFFTHDRLILMTSSEIYGNKGANLEIIPYKGISHIQIDMDSRHIQPISVDITASGKEPLSFIFPANTDIYSLTRIICKK